MKATYSARVSLGGVVTGKSEVEREQGELSSPGKMDRWSNRLTVDFQSLPHGVPGFLWIISESLQQGHLRLLASLNSLIQRRPDLHLPSRRDPPLQDLNSDAITPTHLHQGGVSVIVGRSP